MKKIILAALFLFLIAGVYGVGYSEDGSGFATFGGTRMCMSDGSVPLTGTWDFSNVTISGGFDLSNVTVNLSNAVGDLTMTGILSIVDTDNTSDAFSKGLQMRSEAEETGTAFVWIAHPNETSNRSYLISQDTAHGPLSGQPNWERAWYYIENDTGNFTFVNAFKYLSHIEQNSKEANLILTGLKGITSVDSDIRIGQGVLDLDNRSAQFYRYAKFFNGFGIIIDDTTDTQRTVLVLDSNDDLYIKNEVPHTQSGDIVLQNRDGSNVLTTRMRIRDGNNPDIDITSSNIDMNDNSLKKLSEFSIYSPDNTLWTCTINNSGSLSCS